MLVHRLRRWPNIEPTMAQWLVFAGYLPLCTEGRHNNTRRNMNTHRITHKLVENALPGIHVLLAANLLK